jgi:hypothetical protein
METVRHRSHSMFETGIRLEVVLSTLGAERAQPETEKNQYLPKRSSWQTADVKLRSIVGPLLQNCIHLVEK